MRWRVRLGYPVAVVFLVLARPIPRAIMIGGLVAAFGLLVRGLASGHLRKDEELATTGPYAVTRNPLYFGSAFLAAGFIIAGDSLWAGLIVGVYFAVFYYAVIRNEEADLRRRFGAAFDDVRRAHAVVFPGPSRTQSRDAANKCAGERVFVAAVPAESRISGAAGHDCRTRSRVAADVDSNEVRLLTRMRLLQPVNGVHHALKLRPVDQIERAFLARKHFQCHAPGRGYHSRRFFRGEPAFRDRFHGELD